MKSPTPVMKKQDGRRLKKLEWCSPEDQLPGTYAEYMESRISADFRISSPTPPRGSKMQPDPELPELGGVDPIYTVSVLVDEALFSEIASSLDQYRKDLARENQHAFIETVTGGTPAEIKAWIQEQHESGSRSIFLVGDVTAAWAEVSGSQFPCDLYYMDLDGLWEDTNSDGIFDVHEAGSGDQGPEMAVARLYAHTLNYDTEANLVNQYFAKAHAYRSGTLTQPWRGLEYIDKDWYSMDVCLDRVYGEEIEHHDLGFFTTAEDYLAKMDEGRHFVQVCAHSYSGGHHFSMQPTESASYAHVYVNSPTSRYALLRLGSDDGIKAWFNGSLVCTHDNYNGWSPDQFSDSVLLNPGWNSLLCKISQGGGDYQFSARFTSLSGTPFTDLEYQISHPATHPTQGEFIRSWLINGFHQDSSGNFWNYLTTNYLVDNESQANPTEGQQQGGKTWTTLDSGSPYVDLDEYSGGADYGATYAFVRIHADSMKICQLWLGYDDGARVWLNGTVILNDNRSGGYEQDMRKPSVLLNAGENRLLIKVSEWAGAHGFSARFCETDGTLVEGLTYDPAPVPVNYIGTWLMNGPYPNEDQATRLSHDYLGGEAAVLPSEGDPAAMGVWEAYAGNSCPVDLGAFYDRDGGWVFSDTIQQADPPVLFYNLFACGPGRFTDENYLAGAYIFHTTFGLITVASAKSGSMLNFSDFTKPLGEGATLGRAFRDWFDAQAPFELWEQEWYYGMVLNGDPCLRVQ
ncbi:MAG: C25 family cysteine peptidase [Planctomycetota bacterium]